MECALLLLLDSWVDLLEDTWILCDTHGGELLGSVVLVQGVVGMLLQLLHVCADEHLAQFDEVAVLLIVDLDDTPWVLTSTNLTTIGAGDLRVGPNNCEWNLGHDLVVFGNSLFVVKLVPGTLEDLDGMVFDICENVGKSVQWLTV